MNKQALRIKQAAERETVSTSIKLTLPKEVNQEMLAYCAMAKIKVNIFIEECVKDLLKNDRVWRKMVKEDPGILRASAES